MWKTDKTNSGSINWDRPQLSSWIAVKGEMSLQSASRVSKLNAQRDIKLCLKSRRDEKETVVIREGVNVWEITHLPLFLFSYPYQNPLLCFCVYTISYTQPTPLARTLKQSTWKSDIYHVEWNSIALIHGDKEAFNTLSECIKTCSKLGNEISWNLYTESKKPQVLGTLRLRMTSFRGEW